MTRATLEVRRSNVAAQRLYERLGFAVGRAAPEAYYTQPEEDALILWRRSPAGAGAGAAGRPSLKV